MNRLTIKQLFFLLVTFASFIAVIYISISYLYMKQTVEKSFDLASINKAYQVTKKLVEMNDKLALEYARNEEDMYTSLKTAQAYLKEHGPNASLIPLQKKLQENKKDLRYHIYLINNEFVINNTTYEADLGLSFHVIPDALPFLKKAFSNPEYIDLSSIKDDGISHDYKRYILQHSQSGNYLIQLSLTIEGSKGIHRFTSDLSKNIPSLIHSDLYSVYEDSYKHEFIHLVWSEEYHGMTKKDRLIQRNVSDEFLTKFDPKNEIDKKKYKDYIFKFAHSATYKDSYFYRDNRYMHRVMIPIYSHINADEKTIHILSLEFDETKAKDIIDNITLINIAVWLVLIAFGLILVTLLNRRIIKPISFLQSKMKQKESVPRDLIFENKDEIASMMSIYNQLLNNLQREILSNEELLEQFKTFTANAIHQVRTPTSVIKIALEMIETDNKDALIQIKSSLVSIEHMYDSLAYGLQKEELNFPVEKLNFSKLLHTRIELFNIVALAHDIQIDAHVYPDIYVKMNPTETEYLIDNTLSNAIKYNTNQKNIKIDLSTIGDEVIFSVANTGKPIADKNIIFERYHREDKSRRGSGIGLHMVKNICIQNSIIIDISYLKGYNKFSYYLNKI
ncbi:HAMP domain-containing histidine kinase [Sulfurimonas sp.]|nr:HAMP domain-containing histidine kinase [Sulfurimonas sp.]